MDFMATLEKNNITPNRVTFQLCVALYCQAGDIAGATTILQHMKKNDMAINESVLLSLLSAHCANNDSDSVSSTLDVISNSGITIGVDVYTTMAVSYARSGNWEKVQETLEDADNEGISFDDADIFSIIRGCTHGGLLDESYSLIEKFPKKRGFFQELRIAVPQLALGGNIPVVMQLALTQQDRPGFDKTNQGMFLASSITKSGAPPDKIIPAILQLEEFGYKMSFQYMFQEAAYYFTPERCLQFLEEVQKMKGKENMPEIKKEDVFKYLRFRLENDDDVNKIFQCINNLQVMHVTIPYDFISYDIIPVMLSKRFFRPRETVIDIGRALPGLSYSMICNGMLQYLLNQQTHEHFNSAVGFFLHSNIVHARPHRWNSSLARAYLNTRDVENITSIIHCGVQLARAEERKSDEDMTLKQLFQSLEYIVKQAHLIQPGVPTDELIEPILRDLIKHKIGVPATVDHSTTVHFLQETIKSHEVRGLLSQATEVWEDGLNYWTEEKRKNFHEERKNIFQKKMRTYRGSDLHIATKDEMKDQERLKKKYNELKEEGKVSFKISDNLIQHYLEQDQTAEAVEILKYSRGRGHSFALSPNTLAAFVEAFLRQNKLEDAKQVMLKELAYSQDRKIYSGTLMKCLAAIAAEGDHAEVMRLLGLIDVRKVMEKGSEVELLQRVYVERRDFEKLHEVTEYMFSHQLADPNDSDHLTAFIDIHLEDGNTAGAVEEFTRVANVYGRLAKKFRLTCMLIEREDADGIQKVLDVSTSHVPDLRALYDLAHCFLHMGEKSKAKQLFDSPGLVSDDQKLDYIYRQLESSNPEACQDLVAVTNNLRGCDRNLLFQKLVGTFKHDPDKVEDFWLVVQEEGFIPSEELKIAIADILESHGRTPPFLKPTRPTKKDVNSLVYKAMKSNENHKAVGLFLKGLKETSVSINCSKDLLEHLIKGNDLNRAKVVAARISHGFKDPVKAIDFRHLYYNLLTVLGEKEADAFLSTLHKKLATDLKDKQKPQKNKNEPALDALKSNDLDTVKKFVSEERVSHEMLNRIISLLIKDKKLDEACNVALIVWKSGNFKNIDAIVDQVNLLFSKWGETGDLEKMKMLLSELGRKSHSQLRGDVYFKNALIKTDPDGYLELLTEDFGRDYIVKNKLLIETIHNKPDFLEKLESSADAGNIPATILMSKYHLIHENEEQFSKFYKSCPTDMNPSNIFEFIDSEKKFSMSLDAAGSNQAFLEQIVNNYLRNNSRDKTEFTRIANIAVDSGMELSGFARLYLQRLSKSSDFSLQKEALERVSA